MRLVASSMQWNGFEEPMAGQSGRELRNFKTMIAKAGLLTVRTVPLFREQPLLPRRRHGKGSNVDYLPPKYLPTSSLYQFFPSRENVWFSLQLGRLPLLQRGEARPTCFSGLPWNMYDARKYNWRLLSLTADGVLFCLWAQSQ